MTDTADLSALALEAKAAAENLRGAGYSDLLLRCARSLVPWCRCNDAPAEVGACCDYPKHPDDILLKTFSQIDALTTAAMPSEDVCEYCDHKHPKGWLPNWASSECTPPTATPSAGPVTDEVRAVVDAAIEWKKGRDHWLNPDEISTTPFVRGERLLLDALAALDQAPPRAKASAPESEGE